MKKIYWLLLVCFLFIAGNSLSVWADEGGILLVELVFEDPQGEQYQTQIYAYESDVYSSGYEYRFTDSKFYIPMQTETTEMKVAVRTYDTSELQVLQCYYDETFTVTAGNSVFFNFSMKTNVSYNWGTYVTFYPYYHELSIDNMLLSTGTKGFHPSTDNYLTVRSNVRISIPDDKKAKIRVRILNKKGKYIYQDFVEDIDGDGLFTFRWDGKANKKRVGVKKGKYVGAGTYTVEFVLIFDNGKTTETVTKKKKFVVSYKAPSSVDGLAQAKDIIQYTGDPEIDYMAEQMIKAAGVNVKMTDEEKVRRIYTYMTQNFEHNEGQKTTVKYKLNTKKVQRAVKKFRTATEKKYNKNKLAYSYNYTSISNWTERCMMVRCGVCDDHAEIFTILCNHVGIEAGKCSGYYVNLDGSRHGHAWNYAIVDGRTYYYDVDVEIQNYHGYLNYYWYKKTLEQAKQNHIFY